MKQHHDKDPAHWVVVRLSALGDVILTTGVLRHWHEQYGWTFTVLTRAAFAPVLEGHPAVRGIIGLSDAELRGAALLTRWRELARQHAGQGLIDLHGTGRTRLLGLFWQGPVRHYTKQSLERRLFLQSGKRLFGERLRRLNVPQRYALAVDQTPPERQTLLPCMTLTEAEHRAGEVVAARLCGLSEMSDVDAAGRAPRQLVVLHPYAAHPAKAWPVAHWQQCMASLDARGMPWCVVGQGEALPGVPAVRDLTRRMSLRQSAALVAAAGVLVSGDSGPLHLAGAVGTPVVGLFGPTAPEWGFYPAGARDVVLERDMGCRPCSLHGARRCAQGYACLADIRVEEVVDAVASICAPMQGESA